MSTSTKKIKTINVVVLGASGYSGGELVRLLSNHSGVKVIALTADRHAGRSLDDVFPHLLESNMPKLIKLNQIDWTDVDAAFCCLPHGKTHSVVMSLPSHVKVIDLSADFRFSDLSIYESVYGVKHKAKEMQEQAVYGLTEIFRADIKTTRLVACPGCYPTGAQLPLIPLLESNLILPNNIIIDSKSGVSGAGREPKQETLFAEVNGALKAYNISNHRHGPEIEQGLSGASKQPVQINFTPHLVPINRGILSTIYVNLNNGLSTNDLKECLNNRYKNEYFVRVTGEGFMPSTNHVSGTNKCLIGVFPGRTKSQGIIISVLDNLVKGAAGQALQNFNLMFEFNETMGLENDVVFP